MAVAMTTAAVYPAAAAVAKLVLVVMEMLV